MSHSERFTLKEGQVFGIPLRDGLEGYCLCLISRRQPRGQLAMCYVFGPRLDELPSDLGGWEIPPPEDAVLTVSLSLLPARGAGWVDLGQANGFDRDKWKLTRAIIWGGGPGRSNVVVEYDDKNISKAIEYRPPLVDEPLDGYPIDGVNVPRVLASELNDLLPRRAY